MEYIKAVHTGISGFPFGSAAIYKCLSVYRCLRDIGVEMTIINNRAIHGRDIPCRLQKQGSVDGIRYCYTTPSPYKPGSFLMRRIYDVAGRLAELGLLMKMRWRNELDVMFYYPHGLITNLLLYRLLSRLFGVPLICHYVEFRSAFNVKRSWWRRYSDKLFDQYFTVLVDAVLPISHFLEERIRLGPRSRPYVRIPPTTDFDLFEREDRENHVPGYFLFVSHAGYVNHISMVVESFTQLDNEEMHLYLVVYGNPNEVRRIRKLAMSQRLCDRIRVFNRLDYRDLVQKYVKARALMIPLTDSLQDQARFPYKIAEYVATGNPIITTGHGEVRYHFHDGKTALIAKEFNSALLAEKMQYVVDHPVEARAIGAAARKEGMGTFHYDAYSGSLEKLLRKLIR